MDLAPESLPSTARWVPAGRWMLAVGGWLGLLFALSPHDLAVSLRFADQHHWYGKLIQTYGTSPALCCYLAAIAVLLVPTWRRRNRLLTRASAAILTQALLHTLAITDALKFWWGRVRFIDLSADHADYTPFYLPLAGDGLSFPSGHVATACVFFPLALLLWRGQRRRAALLVGAAVIAFAGAVAAGRVLYGAHYLTDTWFSLGLGVLIAPLSIWLGDRYLLLFDRRPRAAVGSGD